MTKTSLPPIATPPSRLFTTLKALVRARVTAGLITVLPILITLWVVSLLFTWLRDASGWVLKGFLLSPAGEPWMKWLHFDTEKWEKFNSGPPIDWQHFYDCMPWHVSWAIALFSVLLTVFVLYTIGLFVANVFGRRLLDWVEQLVDRMPLIKTVYRGLKQILKNFSADTTQNFQRVAMFPFLSPGVYSIGFVTSVFLDPNTSEEYVTIFYATTPNPTTGYVIIMKRADIVELDWTVEEAVKVIMSGGILMPPGAAVPHTLRLRESMLRTAVGDGA